MSTTLHDLTAERDALNRRIYDAARDAFLEYLAGLVADPDLVSDRSAVVDVDPADLDHAVVRFDHLDFDGEETPYATCELRFDDGTEDKRFADGTVIDVGEDLHPNWQAAGPYLDWVRALMDVEGGALGIEGRKFVLNASHIGVTTGDANADDDAVPDVWVSLRSAFPSDSYVIGAFADAVFVFGTDDDAWFPLNRASYLSDYDAVPDYLVGLAADAMDALSDKFRDTDDGSFRSVGHRGWAQAASNVRSHLSRHMPEQADEADEAAARVAAAEQRLRAAQARLDDARRDAPRAVAESHAASVEATDDPDAPAFHAPGRTLNAAGDIIAERRTERDAAVRELAAAATQNRDRFGRLCGSCHRLRPADAGALERAAMSQPGDENVWVCNVCRDGDDGLPESLHRILHIDDYTAVQTFHPDLSPVEPAEVRTVWLDHHPDAEGTYGTVNVHFSDMATLRLSDPDTVEWVDEHTFAVTNPSTGDRRVAYRLLDDHDGDVVGVDDEDRYGVDELDRHTADDDGRPDPQVFEPRSDKARKQAIKALRLLTGMGARDARTELDEAANWTTANPQTTPARALVEAYTHRTEVPAVNAAVAHLAEKLGVDSGLLSEANPADGAAWGSGPSVFLHLADGRTAMTGAVSVAAADDTASGGWSTVTLFDADGQYLDRIDDTGLPVRCADPLRIAKRLVKVVSNAVDGS